MKSKGADRLGLLAVVWQLNRLAAPHTEKLGDAVLKVGFFGLPYATQYTAPEAMQRWYIKAEGNRTHEYDLQGHPNQNQSQPLTDSHVAECEHWLLSF